VNPLDEVFGHIKEMAERGFTRDVADLFCYVIDRYGPRYPTGVEEIDRHYGFVRLHMAALENSDEALPTREIAEGILFMTDFVVNIQAPRILRAAECLWFTSYDLNPEAIPNQIESSVFDLKEAGKRLETARYWLRFYKTGAITQQDADMYPWLRSHPDFHIVEPEEPVCD
jgi:hypothetical protein